MFSQEEFIENPFSFNFFYGTRNFCVKAGKLFFSEKKSGIAWNFNFTREWQPRYIKY